MARLAGLVITAMLLVVGTPAAAVAETWTGRDPSGDVSGHRTDRDDSTCGFSVTDVDAGPEPNEDIRVVRVRHSSPGLRITVRLRHLDPEMMQSVTTVLRTAHGSWSLDVHRDEPRAGSIDSKVHATWTRLPKRPGECGDAARIRYVTGAVDLSTGRVTASVPARLLRGARWVRVSVAAARWFRIPGVEPTPDGFYAYTTYVDQWADGAFSPRIRLRPGVVS